ncbi:MAG: ParB/RepB/Spo0J family partition protein [Gammaproteobacteria bacterium]|nr:ParB/RepB/Spo0J family partition protein [Gammaproteobacteria bacterium]
MRKPLGKGLDALLGEVAHSHSSQSGDGLTEVPISQVKPNPNQPRKVIDENSLTTFAESIKQQGVMHPITVRRVDDGTYQIIMGERRWHAARIAGLSTVPVLERQATDSEAMVLALVENLQREDLNPYDAAVALQSLQEEHGFSQEEVANAVGKSRSTISNSIRLLNLHKSVHELLRSGELEEGSARALLALPEQSQPKVAQKVVKNRLSVRETEKLVRRHNKSNVTKRTNPDTLRLEQELSDALGAGVNITQRGKRGGYLRIQYRNLEQLQNIIDRIKSPKTN